MAKNDEERDLPRKSEVDEDLPKGHVASRDQVGKPQPLQGLGWRDAKGNQRHIAVVVSTGRTHHDERVADAILAANPPQPVIPAQDPTPLEPGDEIPVDPVTGEISLQGGPSRVLSTRLPVVATEDGETFQETDTPDVAKVGKAQTREQRTAAASRSK